MTSNDLVIINKTDNMEIQSNNYYIGDNIQYLKQIDSDSINLISIHHIILVVISLTLMIDLKQLRTIYYL